MMRRVVVREESADGLSALEWAFAYFDEWHALVLDAYSAETRATKRHKFRPRRSYVRLHGGRAGRFDLSELVPEADVPLPRRIEEKARAEFLRELEVTPWSQIQRRQR